MTAGEAFDAHLDPWCEAPLDTGDAVLFGYALHHEETGGLAWLRSSRIVRLQPRAKRAWTASGRRYRLGRRFDPLDVGAEGGEARVAFGFLLGVEFDLAEELRDLEHQWLVACKAARHLGLDVPSRTARAVRTFLEKHAGAYLELRRNRDPGLS